MKPFSQRVYDTVRSLPAGSVSTYGTIAAAAGSVGSARQVGRLLASLGEETDVPWWRVINARGEVSIPRSGGGASLQRALLEDEGVAFGDDGRVDLRRYGWRQADDADDDR